MKKLIKRQRKQPGLSPGTLVHIGERKSDDTRFTVYRYDEHTAESISCDTVDRLPEPDPSSITWILVDGIHDIAIVDAIGKRYNLHPLILEDIVNTDQRPKLEDYNDYLFIVLKILVYDETVGEVRAEQISMIIGSNLVLSFVESERGLFEPVRERIRTGKGRIRKMAGDYLAYALMDLVIDHYFILFEKIGDRIEAVERELIENPTISTLHSINALKREMLFLKKTIWPLREIISVIERRDSPIIRPATAVYLRDLYDHAIQVIDTIETLRDLLTGMLDIYLSSLSNKANEVIKVLTIIATIFIPLTFIVGIYGMNFDYMPELAWRWAYPGIMILMAFLVAGMLIYFKRKHWI
jgi:magnesium transporter